MAEYGPKEDVGYRGLIGSDANISDVTKQVAGKRIIHEDETGVLVYLGDQTTTTEFRRWFGDSKVVDVEGKPLVVYHGTADEFDEFSASNYGGIEGGIFFTVDKVTADNFAVSASETVGADPRVLAVYLAISNPKKIDASEIMDDGCHSFNHEFAAVDRARREGHDGLLIRNVPEHDGRVANQFVVFRPEQIKSAIGNRGTFDPSDPNILR